jgi:hypothetical protein
MTILHVIAWVLSGYIGLYIMNKSTGMGIPGWMILITTFAGPFSILPSLLITVVFSKSKYLNFLSKTYFKD